MRLLCVGGGSVGHIAPSLAVWQAIQAEQPESSVHFVCSPRATDAPFLENLHLPFTVLDAPRLSPRFPWKFWQAYRQAHQILEQEQPNLVFSKGGYISVPLCLAAWRKNIPIVLHESDVVSGRANRLVGALARRICTGWPRESASPKYVHTGNPVRAEIARGSAEEGRRLTGFRPDKPVLIVLGGSQGSQALNQAIEAHLETLLANWQIIHLTGANKGSSLEKNGYWSRPFVTNALPHLYAIADLALTRASGGVLSELATAKIAPVLVPLRGVGHDHQQRNAELLAGHEAGIIVQQDTLQEHLLPLLQDLNADLDKRQSLAKNLHSLHKTEAVKRLAKVIKEVLAEKG